MPGRILCLHGGRSKGSITRYQLRVLVSEAKARGLDYEFVYAEGSVESMEPNPEFAALGFKPPFYSHLRIVNADEATAFETDELYGGGLSPAEEKRYYVDIPNGVARLRRRFFSSGTGYVGVFGFSQGANVLAMLMADYAKRGVRPPFEWAVLAGSGEFGWAASAKDRNELFETPISTRTLLIIGKEDPVYECGAFGKVCELFDPKSYTAAYHNDGHRPFPKDTMAARALASGVLDFIAKSIGDNVKTEDSATERA